jgi:hypothetical protein
MKLAARRPVVTKACPATPTRESHEVSSGLNHNRFKPWLMTIMDNTNNPVVGKVIRVMRTLFLRDTRKLSRFTKIPCGDKTRGKSSQIIAAPYSRTPI